MKQLHEFLKLEVGSINIRIPYNRYTPLIISVAVSALGFYILYES